MVGGLWFSPERKRFSLKNLEGIEERFVRVPQKGAKREDLRWAFLYKDGDRRELWLSDLFVENRDRVKVFLKGRGAIFLNQGE